MTVYKDLSMINEFINHIPNDWGIYIHIDKKSDITPSQINRGNIVKLLSIHWGSREHLDAFLLLLQKAIESNENYDYYHLVTGQDFFAISPMKFDEVLGDNHNIYMGYFSLPRPNWWNYRILKYKTLASCCDIRKPFYKIINIIYCYFQALTLQTRGLPPYSLYGGSVYCSLTREAVDEIITSEIAKDLYRRLENSLCGEEIFFQTVLVNSTLRDKICNNHLRYMDWNVKIPPKILLEEDFSQIKKEYYLFCRKLDSIKSSQLLQLIEKSIYL